MRSKKIKRVEIENLQGLKEKVEISQKTQQKVSKKISKLVVVSRRVNIQIAVVLKREKKNKGRKSSMK
jgi:hypothetical protein